MQINGGIKARYVMFELIEYMTYFILQKYN